MGRESTLNGSYEFRMGGTHYSADTVDTMKYN